MESNMSKLFIRQDNFSLWELMVIKSNTGIKCFIYTVSHPPLSPKNKAFLLVCPTPCMTCTMGYWQLSHQHEPYCCNDRKYLTLSAGWLSEFWESSLTGKEFVVPSTPSPYAVTVRTRNKTLGMWTMQSCSVDTPVRRANTRQILLRLVLSQPPHPTPPWPRLPLCPPETQPVFLPQALTQVSSVRPISRWQPFTAWHVQASVRSHLNQFIMSKVWWMHNTFDRMLSSWPRKQAKVMN